MARLYYNHLYSFLSADIGAVTTTLPLTVPFKEGGVNIPTINLGVDTMSVSVDEEVMYVTAYTSGALTATVLRAQEGTAAVDHDDGARVYNTATKMDVSAAAGDPGTVVVAQSSSAAEWLAAADYICDGVADNVEIQSAINDAEDFDGGGRVLLSPDSFLLADQLEVGFCSVEGGGIRSHPYGIAPQTLLSTPSGATFPHFENNYQMTIENLRLWQNGPSNSTEATHINDYGNTLRIEDCHIRQNWWGNDVPAILGQSYNVQIRDSYLHGNERAAFVSNYNGYVMGEIARCYFYGGGGTPSDNWPALIVIEGSSPSATYFDDSNAFFAIHHNISDGNSMPLVRVQRAGADVRIHNNVWPWDDGNLFPQVECVLAEKVDIHDNRLSSSVLIDDSRDILVKDNHISYGQIDVADSYDIMIDGNEIIDAADAGYDEYILVRDSTVDVVISNNMGRARDGVAPTWGINISAFDCQDNMLRSNSMDAPLQDLGNDTDAGFDGAITWYGSDGDGLSVRHPTNRRSVEVVSGDDTWTDGEYAIATISSGLSSPRGTVEVWAASNEAVNGYGGASLSAVRSGTDATTSNAELWLNAEDDLTGVVAASLRASLGEALATLNMQYGAVEVSNIVDATGLRMNDEGAAMSFNGETPVVRPTITGDRSVDTVQILTDLLAFLDARGDITDSTTP